MRAGWSERGGPGGAGSVSRWEGGTGKFCDGMGGDVGKVGAGRGRVGARRLGQSEGPVRDGVGGGGWSSGKGCGETGWIGESECSYVLVAQHVQLVVGEHVANGL